MRDQPSSSSSAPFTTGQRYQLLPGTQRCVDQGSDTTLGLEAETSAAVKAAKYADHDNFIPFILETGERVNKVAREWLDTPPARSQAKRVPTNNASRTMQYEMVAGRIPIVHRRRQDDDDDRLFPS